MDPLCAYCHQSTNDYSITVFVFHTCAHVMHLPCFTKYVTDSIYPKYYYKLDNQVHYIKRKLQFDEIVCCECKATILSGSLNNNQNAISVESLFSHLQNKEMVMRFMSACKVGEVSVPTPEERKSRNVTPKIRTRSLKPSTPLAPSAAQVEATLGDLSISSTNSTSSPKSTTKRKLSSEETENDSKIESLLQTAELILPQQYTIEDFNTINTIRRTDINSDEFHKESFERLVQTLLVNPPL